MHAKKGRVSFLIAGVDPEFYFFLRGRAQCQKKIYDKQDKTVFPFFDGTCPEWKEKGEREGKNGKSGGDATHVHVPHSSLNGKFRISSHAICAPQRPGPRYAFVNGTVIYET